MIQGSRRPTWSASIPPAVYWGPAVSPSEPGDPPCAEPGRHRLPADVPGPRPGPIPADGSTGPASGTTPAARGTPARSDQRGTWRGSSRPGRTIPASSGAAGRTIECTPIVVDGVMYVTTGYLRVVAIDAATGKQRWQFDPLKAHPFEHRPASGGVNRGCAYWSDGRPGRPRRIIHGTSDGRLFSLDAETGQLDPELRPGGRPEPPRAARPEGRRGSATGRRRPRPSGRTRSSSASPAAKAPASPRRGTSARSTSAPARLVWRFRTVPRPGEFGYRDLAGRVLEGPRRRQCLGRVQRRRGSRPGLRRPRIGRLRLLRRRPPRRQPVRQLHDRPRRAGPAGGSGTSRRCITTSGTTTCRSIRTSSRVTRDGKADRRRRAGDQDGLCLPVRPRDGQAAVRRRGAARAGLRRARRAGRADAADPGQAASLRRPSSSMSPTSPRSARPTGHRFWPGCGTIRGGPAFNPPSLQGTVVIPGYHGGANWSGASFDPTTGSLYVNSNNVPNIITLVESKAGGPPGTEPRSRGLRTVPRPRGLSGHQASLGRPDRDRPERGRTSSGRSRWASMPELTARGIPRTGTETFGGSIVTAGGLVFIAGTKDERIPRLRQADRATALGTPPPRRRLRHAFDLSGQRAAVPRHRCRRRRQAADEGR